MIERKSSRLDGLTENLRLTAYGLLLFVLLMDMLNAWHEERMVKSKKAIARIFFDRESGLYMK